MKLNELCRFYVSEGGWIDSKEITYFGNLEDAVSLLWSLRDSDRNFLCICLEDTENEGTYYDEATLGRIVVDKDGNTYWFNMAPNVNYAYSIESAEEIINCLKKNEFFCEYFVLQIFQGI